MARRLPEPLFPLARIAYNYRWSWTPGGRGLFRHLGAHRFNLSGENPVRFLRDLPEYSLVEAATDHDYLARVRAVAEVLNADLARPARTDLGEGPVVLCAEFGVHTSLPVYSGGLGVLAGDLLKEASDQALPLVGVGLLYRKGYFHQRVDRSGWQHEYWTDVDPQMLPAVRVSNPDRSPLTIQVPIWDDEVAAHVWRVDVGRVPLYLLDADLAENNPLERWVSARLYEGNRAIRLAEYALLGGGRDPGARRDVGDAHPHPPERGPCRAGHPRRGVADGHLRAESRRRPTRRSRAWPQQLRVHHPHSCASGQRELQPRRDPPGARVARRRAGIRPRGAASARPRAPI